MNTRSTSDKSEIDDLYKTAIANQGKFKHNNPTLCTSTPTTSKFSSKQVDFSLDDSEIVKDLSKTLTNTLVSDDYEDITIQPGDRTNLTPKIKSDKTMSNPNPFATLKYAVEAVPFFDGKNIPLSYFIEGCEEAKSMLPDEAECLIPEIEQKIARNLSVQETMADALRIERELNSMTDLRRGQEDISDITNTNKREICQICYKEGHLASNCRKLTNWGTEILICQICQKREHSADKCRLRDPLTLQSVNILQGSNIICPLCSKFGHNAKSCRMNNNNNQSKLSIICQWEIPSAPRSRVCNKGPNGPHTHRRHKKLSRKNRAGSTTGNGKSRQT
ncbi:hypothetical protein ALC57_16787 [Trachymyrmex cornetzi]|uniref:CCHC-type domain-containing protein n=1 Tax=Trachymyrmex cornetzi TaxID=471704 RepID=A0A151IUD8_9HYME|nr:hypothetical protein ALC57_16787 [Trachymyrmex cornetzi]